MAFKDEAFFRLNYCGFVHNKQVNYNLITVFEGNIGPSRRSIYILYW